MEISIDIIKNDFLVLYNTINQRSIGQKLSKNKIYIQYINYIKDIYPQFSLCNNYDIFHYIINDISIPYKCVDCGKILHIRNDRQYPKRCLEHSRKSDEIKNIIKQNVYLKYGVDNVSQLQINKQKIKEYRIKHKDEEQIKRSKTNIERYGVDNVMKYLPIYDQWKNRFFSENVQNKINENRKQSYILNGHPIKKKTKNELKLISNKAQTLIRRINFIKYFLKKLDKYNLTTEITVDTFKGFNYEYQYTCNNCHKVFSKKGMYVLNCPYCYNNYRSKYENEIYDYLYEQLNITNILTNVKTLIEPFEVDIYLPDYNIAIEFNGDYYHSDIYKNRLYHQQKYLMLKSKGIRLISIFEYEFIYKKDKIFKFIKNILNNNIQIIYARKCNIRELNNNEYKLFLNNNHLQGYIHSKYKYGLFYNDKLVYCLGISESRYNKKYNFEILRSAFDLNYRIIGGFQKLFKYFIQKYKGSIITYIDLKYFSGELYDKLKYFEYINITNPNYIYTNFNKQYYSRYETQKHLLNNILDNFNINLSEYENMKNNNFNRIYDCGNLIYLYKGDIIYGN